LALEVKIVEDIVEIMILDIKNKYNKKLRRIKSEC